MRVMGDRPGGYDERVEYGETVDCCSRHRRQADDRAAEPDAPAHPPLVDLPDRDPDWMLRHG